MPNRIYGFKSPDNGLEITMDLDQIVFIQLPSFLDPKNKMGMILFSGAPPLTVLVEDGMKIRDAWIAWVNSQDLRGSSRLVN